MTSRSRFADAGAAQAAVERALPSIEAALHDRQVSGLGVLHLVVMDPASPPSRSTFDEAVLYERSVGERARWDVDYAAYARAKARLAWQHGCDGRRVQWLAPHLLAHDDLLVWGGVWLDGIVVAASGAMPAWDEAFSLTVAANLRAIALERAEAVGAR